MHRVNCANGYTTVYICDIYLPSKIGKCPLPLTTRTLIKNNWGCSNGALTSASVYVTLDECDTLCKEESLCVWFEFTPNSGLCEKMAEGCEATVTTVSGTNSYHPTGYIFPECDFSSCMTSLTLKVSPFTTETFAYDSNPAFTQILTWENFFDNS